MSGIGNLLAGAGFGLCVMGLVGCSGSSDSPAEGGGGAAADTGGSPGVGGGVGQNATGGSARVQPVLQEARSDVPHDATPDISTADYRAFVSHTNNFGLDVFDQLVGDDSNVVFSPVSTAVALGMTYAGARGEPATQMATALRNDLSDTTFHAAQNQLAQDLASGNIAPHETVDGTKSVRLSLVNAAWAQRDYPILPGLFGHPERALRPS